MPSDDETRREIEQAAEELARARFGPHERDGGTDHVDADAEIDALLAEVDVHIERARAAADRIAALRIV
jgi:hypothetical protein